MLVVDGGPRPDPGTLTQLFFQAIERYDKPDALQVKIGGRYEPISHRLLLERVRHVATALQRMGAKAGDRVAILSENRPEWAIADYACLTSGVTDVAIYPTLPDSQVAYILNDSGDATVNLNRLPGSAGVSGTGVAVTLTFQAIGRGATTVSIPQFAPRNSKSQTLFTATPLLVVNVK